MLDDTTKIIQVKKENKDNYDVINFFRVDKEQIEGYTKRTIKDGGEVIINKRNTQVATRLSALLNFSTSNIPKSNINVNYFGGCWYRYTILTVWTSPHYFACI